MLTSELFMLPWEWSRTPGEGQFSPRLDFWKIKKNYSYLFFKKLCYKLPNLAQDICFHIRIFTTGYCFYILLIAHSHLTNNRYKLDKKFQSLLQINAFFWNMKFQVFYLPLMIFFIHVNTDQGIHLRFENKIIKVL